MSVTFKTVGETDEFVNRSIDKDCNIIPPIGFKHPVINNETNIAKEDNLKKSDSYMPIILVVIYFDSTVGLLPKNVYVNFIRTKVSSYVQQVIQCSQFLCYGHTAKAVKAKYHNCKFWVDNQSLHTCLSQSKQVFPSLQRYLQQW